MADIEIIRATTIFQEAGTDAGSQSSTEMADHDP